MKRRNNMKIDLTDALKTVINYYETALKDKVCSVNCCYESNCKTREKLIQGGILNKYYIGSIFVGKEHKGHLFVTAPGSGDCSELFICKGKI